MKATGILLLFVTVMVSAAFVPLQAQSGRKMALLIGIGDYPEAGGWQKIHATNDLVIIRQALINRGFSEENILTLKDAEATREGILSTWKERFAPKVKAGDIVYIHFSGHGQQVADDNGDEIDGYDEGIVPYDSPLRYEKGVYTGERLIRDDEINALVTALRKQLGPKGNLMLVLDACHSGTGTRGMTPARGTDIPMASPEYITSNLKHSSDSPDTTQFAVPEESLQLAPMAAFFGSAHNQLNFETQDAQGQLLGSLSYALSKVFSNAPPNTSYRGLFDQVRLEMSRIAPKQQPQAEGTLDQEILGGKLLERPAYFSVSKANGPDQVLINAGSLQGLNPGAVVALYPPETRDTAGKKPLAIGKVSGVFPFEAMVDNLTPPVSIEAAKTAWVYVQEQNFGDLTLGVELKLPEQHPVRQLLETDIAQNYPVFRLGEAPEVFLIDSGAELQLIGPSDVLVQSFSKNQTPRKIAEAIIEALKGYTRVKYVRQMEAQSAYLKVDFEIIPVEAERLPDGRVVEKKRLKLESKLDQQGMLHFQVGDFFRLRIINRGRKAAYFTLVDLQPNNVSNCLIPGQFDKYEKPADFRIAPGQKLDVPRHFEVGPPGGVEMFKLFVTEDPVDLRPIMNSQGAQTRGPQLKPLERLFGETYLNDSNRQTRSGNTSNLATGSLHIFSYTFIIDAEQ